LGNRGTKGFITTLGLFLDHGEGRAKVQRPWANFSHLVGHIGFLLMGPHGAIFTLKRFMGPRATRARYLRVFPFRGSGDRLRGPPKGAFKGGLVRIFGPSPCEGSPSIRGADFGVLGPFTRELPSLGPRGKCTL